MRRSSLLCLTVLIAAGGLMSSCKDEPPPKPQVVRKKIVLPPGQTLQKAATPDKGAPQKTALAALRPKSDISKPQTAKAATAPKKTVTAKTPQVKPAPAKTPSASTAPQVPMRPKSEISRTDQTAATTTIAAKSDIAQSGRPPASAKPIVDIAASPSATAQPLTPAALAEDGQQLAYDPTGKLDPFEPLFKETVPVVEKKKEPRRPRTPLERMALNQLKLVAIVMSPSGNRALVQESSGKGYIIRKGTYIGLNSGKVVEISKDKLVIEEKVENIMGEVTVRKKELALPKPPGEL